MQARIIECANRATSNLKHYRIWNKWVSEDSYPTYFRYPHYRTNGYRVDTRNGTISW